jgi:predicted MPP superfamily phosphohydrolase
MCIVGLQVSDLSNSRPVKRQQKLHSFDRLNILFIHETFIAANSFKSVYNSVYSIWLSQDIHFIIILGFYMKKKKKKKKKII